MSTMSIKVVLAGRNYPLTINEGEEEKVRQAVSDINNSIKRLQENYAVKDMQDLLAMTALRLATRSSDESSPSRAESIIEEQAVVEKLQALSRFVEE